MNRIITLCFFVLLSIANIHGSESSLRLTSPQRAWCERVLKIHYQWGFNALMYGIIKNRKETVFLLKFLKEAKAESPEYAEWCTGIVNAKDCADWTPLMYASLYGYSDIVQKLLELGADVNAQNAISRTALMMAVDRNRDAVVQLLVRQANINLDLHDRAGKTAYMLAKIEGNQGIINALGDGIKLREFALKQLNQEKKRREIASSLLKNKLSTLGQLLRNTKSLGKKSVPEEACVAGVQQDSCNGVIYSPLLP